MRLLRRSLVMATSNLFPVFPTPISLYNFGNESHEMNMALVTDIFKEEKDNDGKVRSNMGGWHSKGKLEEKYESFNLLREQIEICCNDYANKTGSLDGLEIRQLWANINRCGDYNMAHYHPGSVLTGVYYPIAEIADGNAQYQYAEDVTLIPSCWDGKDGGSVVFHHPAYGKQDGLRNGPEASPYSIEHYHFYPVAGVLIIFPAHLIHTVTPFKSQKTRISISFCCSYKDNGTN